MTTGPNRRIEQRAKLVGPTGMPRQVLVEASFDCAAGDCSDTECSDLGEHGRAPARTFWIIAVEGLAVVWQFSDPDFWRDILPGFGEPIPGGPSIPRDPMSLLSWHSAIPIDGYDAHGPCEFLGGMSCTVEATSLGSAEIDHARRDSGDAAAWKVLELYWFDTSDWILETLKTGAGK